MSARCSRCNGTDAPRPLPKKYACKQCGPRLLCYACDTSHAVWCGQTTRTVGPGMARAVDRFSAGGPSGYRAATMPNAPIRSTRDEAVADEIAWLDSDERARRSA